MEGTGMYVSALRNALSLSRGQKESLISAPRAAIFEEAASATDDPPAKCPRCGHAHVARKGHGRKGARAWLCRGCERRAEVADIFMSEYDEERVREIAAKANYRWGHDDGFDEGLLAAVNGLMRRRGWDIHEAMDAVGIPEVERPRYAGLVAKL
jgi:predicted RNA-binding Zn-ribbon protein involved in translation (DUF1610 family)